MFPLILISSPQLVPRNPSPNTRVSPFTPLFHLSHSPSLKLSTNTCSYPLTPDSIPHKPLLYLFYPPQYNRSKKEIPIHQFGPALPTTGNGHQHDISTGLLATKIQYNSKFLRRKGRMDDPVARGPCGKDIFTARRDCSLPFANNINEYWSPFGSHDLCGFLQQPQQGRRILHRSETFNSLASAREAKSIAGWSM